MPLEQLLAMRTVSAASKFEQLISEAPSAVVVLTAADIKAYGWRTLADALATLPGVYVTSDKNYSYVGARGFLRPGDYNSRFLLLVDGARTNDAVYGQASIGYEGLIDMDMVQRIEFVPGPGSAVYGSNALFGVINVVTKDGSDLKGAQIAVGTGSLGERKLRASWGWHGQNGADLVLSASSYGRDGENLYYPEYDTPDQNRGVAEGLDYERAHNFLVKASYAGLTLSASHVRRTKGVPTGSFGAVFNTSNWTVDAQSMISLAYARDISPTVNLSAQATWGKADYLGIGDYPGDTRAQVTNVDGDHARWYGASVQATVTTLPRNKFVFGAELGRDARRDQFNFDVEPFRQLLDERRSANRSGLFFADEIRVSNNLLLNLGVRHDRHSTGTRSTSPRAALLYKLTPADTVKLIYGTSFRVPNAYELYYAYSLPVEAGSQITNPDLGHERIRTVETVLEHALGSAGHATFSVFQYDMRGLITQQADEETGALVFRNVAQARATGAEAALERLIGGGARVRASYAWQRSHDGNGAALVSSPRHLAKLNAVVPLAANTRLGGEVQCMSSRLTEHARTGGYCLANLTLVSSEVFAGADLSLGIRNATDQRYADPAGPAFVQEAVAREGRTLHARLSYQF
ncbi:TonB-dependent receptor [Massilia sp. Dwa41.01b]|nr:TonB-dependent receptor [Massilia sp. Dwa41.01b]